MFIPLYFLNILNIIQASVIDAEIAVLIIADSHLPLGLDPVDPDITPIRVSNFALVIQLKTNTPCRL
jgi:hypothetical protein